MMSPEEETRESILRAAAHVFGERGYEGATTRGIAAEAGVNEVTLFRHFGNKKNLFLAMMEWNSAVPGLETTLKEQLTGDCRQDLIGLGSHFLTMTIKNRRAVLMTLCAAERLPELREVAAQMPMQQRRMFAGYLQQQIERGAIRDVDADMAAQALLGMLLSYAIRLGLEADTPTARVPVETVVAQFVDIFMYGAISQ